MYNSIVNEKIKILYLASPSGSGKSNLAKQLSNYLEERDKISKVKYLNIDFTSSINAFLAKISGFQNNENISIHSSTKPSLIILDHANSIIEKHCLLFRKEL